MNYWIHRISYLSNISYPLLESGYISIGYSDFCDEEFLEKTSDGDWNYFEARFDKDWKYRPKMRYSLWRFVAEMKKGDWVIVPSWGTFSLYEVSDSRALLASNGQIELPQNDWNGNKICRHSSGNMIRLENEANYSDIGFLRKVTLISRDIPRYEFADAALTSRMKIRTTNANVNDLESSIRKALEAFKSDRPIDLKSQIIEQTIDIWHSSILENLNADKFEQLVKWYFVRIGATEVIIPSKNYANKTGDVDVVATFEKIRTIINTQVKFHRGETSDWAICQIMEFSESSRSKKSKEDMFDGYHRQNWVISSSDSYSEESYNKAKENNILLIDGRQFARMLIDAGIENLQGFLEK